MANFVLSWWNCEEKCVSQTIHFPISIFFFLKGMAALHEAVLAGNLECVKLLVKYGADVHQRDEDGWTPLHMACSDGYPEIARYVQVDK